MKFLHTMVRARDLDETLDFYCDKLGLVEVNRYDSEAGRFTLVFLAAPGDADTRERARARCVKSPGTGIRRNTMADETSATWPIGWTTSTTSAST